MRSEQAGAGSAPEMVVAWQPGARPWVGPGELAKALQPLQNEAYVYWLGDMGDANKLGVGPQERLPFSWLSLTQA